MRDSVRRSIEQDLGTSVVSVRPLPGGDINEAFEVRLEDGRGIFVKTHALPPENMFVAEARGLAYLRETDALRVPEVRSVTSSYLALEFLDPGPRVADFDERLGRGLAALHRYPCATFGGPASNYIATLLQRNESLPSWSEFYRECRIRPQVRLAADAGKIPPRLRRRLEALMDRFEVLLSEPDSPSRVHGDLWGGNLHVDADGMPALIDPAAYGGHREMDLAMMKLFGGFSEAVFMAYQEAFPLSAGAQERVSLHQLYPLLVHVNLFGGSYESSVEQIVRRYA